MYIVVFITASSKKEAEALSKGLLAKKLIACANIARGVESFFWWESKIDSAKEFLVIAKSKKTKLSKIIKLVKSLHSYSVPEVIGLPLIGGNKDYLNWLDESLR